jgi:hypothetical protein
MEISREQAIVIAHEESRKRGWPGLSQFEPWQRRLIGLFNLNYNARGANVLVTAPIEYMLRSTL